MIKNKLELELDKLLCSFIEPSNAYEDIDAPLKDYSWRYVLKIKTLLAEYFKAKSLDIAKIIADASGEPQWGELDVITKSSYLNTALEIIEIVLRGENDECTNYWWGWVYWFYISYKVYR